ncbi:MAG: hypothetical protein ACRCST_11320 [Turicibacter sp.]
MKKSLLIVLTLMGLMGCQSTPKAEEISKKSEVEVPEVEEDETDLLEPQIMFQLDELPQAQLQYLNYLGRDEAYDVYYSTPYDNNMGNADELDSQFMFYFTTPSTFDVMITGEMEFLLSQKIKLINDKIYVMNPDYIIEIANQFNDIQTIEMPVQIASEENLYGYDVSDNLSQFIYSNNDGLWFLESKEAAPVLLREPLKFEPNPLIEFGYYQSPTFINESQDVIVDVGAYEGSAGYVFCELNKLTCDEEASGTQQDLQDLAQNKQFLQVATNTGGYIPWQYHWVDLKSKTLLDELPVEFLVESGEMRQIDDYLQLGDLMYFAVGTRDELKFLPKYIDIEVYQMEDDRTLSYIKQLERVDDIALSLIGATPEGNVIYSQENYDPKTSSGHLEIHMTR